MHVRSRAGRGMHERLDQPAPRSSPGRESAAPPPPPPPPSGTRRRAAPADRLTLRPPPPASSLPWELLNRRRRPGRSASAAEMPGWRLPPPAAPAHQCGRARVRVRRGAERSGAFGGDGRAEASREAGTLRPRELAGRDGQGGG